MRPRIYVIEARNPDGTLNFADPQPEAIFGSGAITGMTDDAIAKTVYRLKPAAVLTGDRLSLWPAEIDKRFCARLKTWGA